MNQDLHHRDDDEFKGLLQQHSPFTLLAWTAVFIAALVFVGRRSSLGTDPGDFDDPAGITEMTLAPRATPFQAQVLAQLQKIPYGETCSYRDIAVAIGNPKAVRAVGGANGANPIPIIIPCHRVIGSNGTLTGFGGGLDSKRFLLDLETRHSGLFGN